MPLTKMKGIYLFSLFLFLLLACKKDSVNEQQTTVLSLEQKVSKLKNPKDDFVLVASHRGNWQNHPENSLAAIQSCIDLGVDIVEIDVQKTKDGVLVVLHDSTLDRTSSGSGAVSNKTLTEIKELYLYDRYKVLTDQKVPTLKEVMQLAKGKIIVMIDKANDSFSLTHEILKETETVSQALFLEFYDYDEVIPAMSKSLFDNSLYVPRVKEDKTNPQKYLTPFIENEAADAVELRFSQTTAHTLEVIPMLKTSKTSIWMTTLPGDFSANYNDQISLANPDLGWGKCVELGANVIMTDYPEQLIQYLTKNNLH